MAGKSFVELTAVKSAPSRKDIASQVTVRQSVPNSCQTFTTRCNVILIFLVVIRNSCCKFTCNYTLLYGQSFHGTLLPYNRDEKCLLRGTNWVFKERSLRFVFKALICTIDNKWYYREIPNISNIPGSEPALTLSGHTICTGFLSFGGELL